MVVGGGLVEHSRLEGGCSPDASKIAGGVSGDPSRMGDEDSTTSCCVAKGDSCTPSSADDDVSIVPSRTEGEFSTTSSNTVGEDSRTPPAPSVKADKVLASSMDAVPLSQLMSTSNRSSPLFAGSLGSVSLSVCVSVLDSTEVTLPNSCVVPSSILARSATSPLTISRSSSIFDIVSWNNPSGAVVTADPSGRLAAKAGSHCSMVSFSSASYMIYPFYKLMKMLISI